MNLTDYFNKSVGDIFNSVENISISDSVNDIINGVQQIRVGDVVNSVSNLVSSSQQNSTTPSTQVDDSKNQGSLNSVITTSGSVLNSKNLLIAAGVAAIVLFFVIKK